MTSLFIAFNLFIVFCGGCVKGVEVSNERNAEEIAHIYFETCMEHCSNGLKNDTSFSCFITNEKYLNKLDESNKIERERSKIFCHRNEKDEDYSKYFYSNQIYLNHSSYRHDGGNDEDVRFLLFSGNKWNGKHIRHYIKLFADDGGSLMIYLRRFDELPRLILDREDIVMSNDGKGIVQQLKHFFHHIKRYVRIIGKLLVNFVERLRRRKMKDSRSLNVSLIIDDLRDTSKIYVQQFYDWKYYFFTFHDQLSIDINIECITIMNCNKLSFLLNNNNNENWWEDRDNSFINIKHQLNILNNSNLVFIDNQFFSPFCDDYHHDRYSCQQIRLLNNGKINSDYLSHFFQFPRQESRKWTKAVHFELLNYERNFRNRLRIDIDREEIHYQLFYLLSLRYSLDIFVNNKYLDFQSINRTNYPLLINPIGEKMKKKNIYQISYEIDDCCQMNILDRNQGALIGNCSMNSSNMNRTRQLLEHPPLNYRYYPEIGETIQLFCPLSIHETNIDGNHSDWNELKQIELEEDSVEYWWSNNRNQLFYTNKQRFNIHRIQLQHSGIWYCHMRTINEYSSATLYLSIDYSLLSRVMWQSVQIGLLLSIFFLTICSIVLGIYQCIILLFCRKRVIRSNMRKIKRVLQQSNNYRLKHIRYLQHNYTNLARSVKEKCVDDIEQLAMEWKDLPVPVERRLILQDGAERILRISHDEIVRLRVEYETEVAKLNVKCQRTVEMLRDRYQLESIPLQNLWNEIMETTIDIDLNDFKKKRKPRKKIIINCTATNNIEMKLDNDDDGDGDGMKEMKNHLQSDDRKDLTHLFDKEEIELLNKSNICENIDENGKLKGIAVMESNRLLNKNNSLNIIKNFNKELCDVTQTRYKENVEYQELIELLIERTEETIDKVCLDEFNFDYNSLLDDKCMEDDDENRRKDNPFTNLLYNSFWSSSHLLTMIISDLGKLMKRNQPSTSDGWRFYQSSKNRMAMFFSHISKSSINLNEIYIQRIFRLLFDDWMKDENVVNASNEKTRRQDNLLEAPSYHHHRTSSVDRKIFSSSINDDQMLYDYLHCDNEKYCNDDELMDIYSLNDLMEFNENEFINHFQFNSQLKRSHSMSDIYHSHSLTSSIRHLKTNEIINSSPDDDVERNLSSFSTSLYQLNSLLNEDDGNHQKFLINPNYHETDETVNDHYIGSALDQLNQLNTKKLLENSRDDTNLVNSTTMPDISFKDDGGAKGKKRQKMLPIDSLYPFDFIYNCAIKTLHACSIRRESPSNKSKNENHHENDLKKDNNNNNNINKIFKNLTNFVQQPFPQDKYGKILSSDWQTVRKRFLHLLRRLPNTLNYLTNTSSSSTLSKSYSNRQTSSLTRHGNMVRDRLLSHRLFSITTKQKMEKVKSETQLFILNDQHNHESRKKKRHVRNVSALPNLPMKTEKNSRPILTEKDEQMSHISREMKYLLKLLSKMYSQNIDCKSTLAALLVLLIQEKELYQLNLLKNQSVVNTGRSERTKEKKKISNFHPNNDLSPTIRFDNNDGNEEHVHLLNDSIDTHQIKFATLWHWLKSGSSSLKMPVWLNTVFFATPPQSQQQQQKPLPQQQFCE
ncbi:hypothetical protein SNEBB_009126 [Seison nebaliae]|nr:hypothetical protein SNEBB_009126 [Seison nebaliae]